MTFPLEAAIRSGLLVLLGLAAAALLRRRSAAHRHAVLGMAMLAAAVAGPLAWIVPGWELPAAREVVSAAPSIATRITMEQPATVVDAPSAWFRTTSALFWLWVAGCAAWGALLTASLWRLHRTASAARPIVDARCVQILSEVSADARLRRPVRLLSASALESPATWGLRRPRVLLPDQALQWRTDRLRLVLRHELAHVSRHDWVVQMCAELLRAVYWFNPFMWIACARLRRESEQACDDEVLRMGVPSHDYAGELLQLARASRRTRADYRATLPMAAPSTLERRIAAMLNPSVNRTAPSRLLMASAAAVLLALTIPIAGLRAAQAGPAPLEGVIYDPTGAVLPGVRVTLSDAQGARTDTETDASGRFEFASIAPGGYVLEAALPGFKSLRQDVRLRDARDWDRAMTLQVGEVSESINVSATRTSAATAVQGPVRVRVGGNIRAPRKLKHVPPVYPPSMRDAGREGTVPIDAIIDRNGAVQWVRVLSANIHPDFAVAAADAVRQWQFAPTLLNGEPVEVRMTVTIRFSLED